MPYLIFVGRNFAIWCQIPSLIPFPYPKTPGRIVIFALEQQGYSFLNQGPAPSIWRLYASVQAQFISFCCQLGRLHSSGSPCPADKWTLCLFANFWPKKFSTHQLHVSSACSGLQLSTLSRGFKTPLPTVFASSRLSVVLSAVSALPLQPVYLPPMN